MKLFKNNYIKIIVIIIAVITVACFLSLYKKKSSQSFKPDSSSSVELDTIISEVGKLTVLPVGEKPDMITISDPDALRGQVFFDGSQKGDKVLVYKKAKRAYLYSPSSKRIINIAPLTIQGDSL
jgi:hypothetical protein